jgi:hypothetical protein
MTRITATIAAVTVTAIPTPITAVTIPVVTPTPITAATRLIKKLNPCRSIFFIERLFFL